MKLKEFFSNVVKNKSNGAEITSFKKRKLKEYGITVEDLLEMKIVGKKKWVS